MLPVSAMPDTGSLSGVGWRGRDRGDCKRDRQYRRHQVLANSTGQAALLLDGAASNATAASILVSATGSNSEAGLQGAGVDDNATVSNGGTIEAVAQAGARAMIRVGGTNRGMILTSAGTDGESYVLAERPRQHQWPYRGLRRLRGGGADHPHRHGFRRRAADRGRRCRHTAFNLNQRPSAAQRSRRTRKLYWAKI